MTIKALQISQSHLIQGHTNTVCVH